jgi:uncharacterized protein YggE
MMVRCMMKVALAALLPMTLTVAAAQSQEKDTVTGVGFVRVQRPATALRMHVQLTAKGKTLVEALARLKEQREAVAAQLEKLNAEKESIAFRNPAVSAAQNAQQRKIESLIAERMAARGKKVAKPAKPLVTVTGMLTAQWPLEADSPEKLLLAAESLQEKIKAANLSGPKDAERLSPEEQELVEEAAGEDNDPFGRSSGSDEEQVVPGRPMFLYVARLAPKEREKAMAEAFAKARSQAGELAKAAGVQLGPLAGLSGQGGKANTGDDMSSYNRRQYMYAQWMASQAAASGQEERPDEAVGPNPASLGFDFYVTATFGMGK